VDHVQVLHKSDTSLYTGVIIEYYRVVEQKKFEERYELGIKEGPYSSWFKNGKLKVKGHYKNKKRVGVWNWYDQNGQLTYSFYYSKAELKQFKY